MGWEKAVRPRGGFLRKGTRTKTGKRLKGKGFTGSIFLFQNSSFEYGRGLARISVYFIDFLVSEEFFVSSF